MDLQFRLALALLTIESSYAEVVERPANGVPDTIQFWLAPDGQWRIRTYAIDHDIHIYRLSQRSDGSRFTAVEAEAHTVRHYGEITEQSFVLSFRDPHDPSEARHILSGVGLMGSLEVGKNGIVFYNPDCGEYRSRSRPE